MGRPKLKIDPEEVEKLAYIGANNLEIAHFFGCNEDTITGRFSDILHKARSKRKSRLRQAQWKSAIENGNIVMQIWLGKQELGQREKSDIAIGGLVDAPPIKIKDATERRKMIEDDRKFLETIGDD